MFKFENDDEDNVDLLGEMNDEMRLKLALQ